MSKNKAHAATPALRALIRASVDFDVLRYEHDPNERHFGEEAVTKLGLEAADVFKTLLVRLKSPETTSEWGVAVLPVAAQLDLKAAAAAFDAKSANLAEPESVQRVTGYIVGGCSPIGMKEALPTLIDVAARGRERIYVSAGRRGLEIALSGQALAEVTGGTFAPISRMAR